MKTKEQVTENTQAESQFVRATAVRLIAGLAMILTAATAVSHIEISDLRSPASAVAAGEIAANDSSALDEQIYEYNQQSKVEGAVANSIEDMSTNIDALINDMDADQVRLGDSVSNSGGKLSAIGQLISLAQDEKEKAKKDGSFEAMQRALEAVRKIRTEVKNVMNIPLNVEVSE